MEPLALPMASFCGNNSAVECNLAKVEVVSVLGFASVLLLYSCSALHSYTRKRISFPAPNGDDGSVLRSRFSLEFAPIRSVYGRRASL